MHHSNCIASVNPKVLVFLFIVLGSRLFMLIDMHIDKSIYHDTISYSCKTGDHLPKYLSTKDVKNLLNQI